MGYADANADANDTSKLVLMLVLVQTCRIGQSF